MTESTGDWLSRHSDLIHSPFTLHTFTYNCNTAQSGHHQHHHRPRVRTSVDSLPSETLKQVFRFLPAPSLCTAEMVCPHWRAVASEDDAWWGALCEAQFGVSPDAFTPPPDPAKWLYMLQAQSLRSIKRGGGGRTGPGSLV